MAEGVLHNSRGRVPADLKEPRGGNVGGKRKADGRHNQPGLQAPSDQQPTELGFPTHRQQPLQQGGDYSGNYGYNNDNQEFLSGYLWATVEIDK